jgi:hypothetical protein
MILTKTAMMLLAALFLVLLVIFFMTVFKKQENFSFGNLFKKIKKVGGNVVNKVKDVGGNVVDKVKDVGGNVVEKVKDVGGGIIGGIGDTVGGSSGKVEVRGKIFDSNFVPVYSYRQQAKNGMWICPNGTVDMGTNDDKQCLSSEIGPRIFRDLGDGNWGYKCPEGTVPNPGTDLPNQQCVRGFSQRRWINGAWKCYATDEDTGVSWENAEWWAAWRQCRKGYAPAVTTRMWNGARWECPPGTDDTGLDWADGADGYKQCKIRPGG